MDLDNTGWPQLPTVGSKIKFRGGGVMLQVLGTCTVVRADHVRSDTGKPGGRVIVQTERGELEQVSLSHVREHGVLIVDGLERQEMEAQIKWAAKRA
jgi:hypothetical protein